MKRYLIDITTIVRIMTDLKDQIFIVGYGADEYGNIGVIITSDGCGYKPDELVDDNNNSIDIIKLKSGDYKILKIKGTN